MKKEDSIYLWFKFLEEMGEYTHIPVLVKNKVTGQVIEHELFHGDTDGIGGLLQMVQKYSPVPFQMPDLPSRKDPPAWVYFINFLRLLSRLPFHAQAWNLGPTDWSLRPGGAEKPSARADLLLSKKDTSLIWSRARDMKVGRNTYFLYHLDRAVLPYHSQQTLAKRIWLIPVNLRTDFRTPEGGNKAGFLDAIIKQDTDVTALHTQLHRAIKRGEAFGGLAGVSIGQFIGKNILKHLVRINERLQNRTGVFTNLGNWKTEGDVEVPSYGLGFPPVMRSQPLGACIVSINGEQALALHFHPRLTRSAALARECLESWVESLMKGG